MEGTTDVDGIVIIGGLGLPNQMPNQTFFMENAHVKTARSLKCLPEEYENGLAIQAGTVGGLKAYILTSYRLKEFCGRVLRWYFMIYDFCEYYFSP